MTQGQQPSEPRFCRQCGANVPENTTTCPRCGQKWFMDRVEQQGVELWQKIIEKRTEAGLGESPPAEQKQYHCPNCYAALPKPASICPSCGKSTAHARIIPQEQEEPAADSEGKPLNLPDAARGLATIKGAQQRASKLHQRKLKTLDIIVISIIVLIVLGIGAILAVQYGAFPSIMNLIRPPEQKPPVTSVEPGISDIAISGITASSTTITWQTKAEVYGKILYGKSADYGMDKAEGNKAITHNLVLQELEPGTSYHFIVLSADRDGKEMERGIDSVFTTPSLPKEIKPLVVTQLKAIPYDTGIIIQWTTDKPASSQVLYGLTPSLEKSTTPDSRLVTNHSVKITSLEANTSYYYRIKSVSADGDETGVVTPALVNTLVSMATGSRVGDRAPDFTLPIFKSQNTLSLRDYKGQKVLLTFWAVYCPECERELAMLQEIKNKNLPGVVVLAVFMESKPEDIEKTISNYMATRGELTVPVLVDMYKTTGHMYNIEKVPCTIFIDSDRIIREIEFGSFNFDQVEKTLNSL
jgi:peroxiredoxin/ribosomal protein L40E